MAVNATPVVRRDHRVVGVPVAGRWVELLNSDARGYGGSGVGNLGIVTATDDGAHGFAHSLALTLPPLAVVFLAPEPPTTPPLEGLDPLGPLVTLGAVVDEGGTTFRVWAPWRERVAVRLAPGTDADDATS